MQQPSRGLFLIGCVVLISLLFSSVPVTGCPQPGDDCEKFCAQYWKDMEAAKTWNEKACIYNCYSSFLENCNGCKKPKPDTIFNKFKKFTAWSVNDEIPAYLRYHEIGEIDPINYSNHIHIEGQIVHSSLVEPDIEAFAFNQENGTMYFINNVDHSTLYAIDPSQIDKNPATPVVPRYIGNTGLLARTQEIAGIEWIDGNLYGFSQEELYLYKIDTANGSVTKIGDLKFDGELNIEAFTQGADGTWYFLNAYVNDSEIWKVDSIKSGDVYISKFMVVTGSLDLEALAAHPSGFLYTADEFNFFKIDPATKTTTLLYKRGGMDPVDIEGLEFYRKPELEALTQTGLVVSGNLNPDGGKLLSYDLTKIDDVYPNGPVISDGYVQGILGARDLEALTVDRKTGTVYVMNNVGTSTLYKIAPTEIDGNGATPVNAVSVGSTGIPAGDLNANDEIVGMEYIDGVIYGISKKSKKIYHINPLTGAVLKTFTIGTSSNFEAGGIAKGTDGSIYLVKITPNGSELWKIVKIEFNTIYFITKICEITGKDRAKNVVASTRVTALGANRDGSLHCADDDTWFNIHLDQGFIEALFKSDKDLHGIGFRN